MADPNFNQNILDAQKKLNKLYQGQKGFLESPENGYLTQASFVSLLTALQIEKVKAFPDFKPYSVSDLLKYWSIKPAMRHQLANALHDGQAMFNNTNTTQLMEIALGLHGESVDLDNRMLSGSAISDESQFAQDLGIDMEGWGMDSEHIAFIAMLSPISVLPKDGSNTHKSIRRAQQAMNHILSNIVNDQDSDTYSLNPVDPAKSDIKAKNFLLGQDDYWQENEVLLNDTDGVSDQETFRSLQRVMQYFQVQDGYSNLSFDEYVHNHFTMQFGDRDRIVWIGLALSGYLLINYDDFYDIPYADRQKAIDLYKKDFKLTTDQDFYEHLFTKYVKAGQYRKQPVFIGTLNQTDATIGSLQSLYYDSNNSLYFDQLHNDNTINDLYKIPFDMNKTIHNFSYGNNRRILDAQKFMDSVNGTDKSKPAEQQLLFGHTQTIYVINNKIITGCNYHHKKMNGTKWCQDFLVVDTNDHSQYKTITNIFGVVAKLADNHKDELNYRNELAITPDLKHIVFCPIDATGKQWFLLYDYQNIANALAKIPNGQTLDLTKIDLQDSFSIDEFSRAFNKNQQVSYPILDSIQGYAIDNDLNLYISSQKAPSNDSMNQLKLDAENNPVELTAENVSHPKILMIPWNHANNQLKYYFDNLLKFDDKLAKHVNQIQDELALSEMEAIQFLPQNNALLVSVTWHLIKKQLDLKKIALDLGQQTMTFDDLINYLKQNSPDWIDLYEIPF